MTTIVIPDAVAWALWALVILDLGSKALTWHANRLEVRLEREKARRKAAAQVRRVPIPPRMPGDPPRVRPSGPPT